MWDSRSDEAVVHVAMDGISDYALALDFGERYHDSITSCYLSILSRTSGEFRGRFLQIRLDTFADCVQSWFEKVTSSYYPCPDIYGYVEETAQMGADVDNIKE